MSSSYKILCLECMGKEFYKRMVVGRGRRGGSIGGGGMFNYSW